MEKTAVAISYLVTTKPPSGQYFTLIKASAIKPFNVPTHATKTEMCC